MKGVPQDYQVKLLEKFQAVTKDDVLAVLETYFLPLFDSSSSVAVVVTAPAKVDEISEGLGGLGFTVEKRSLEVDPNELGDGSDSDSDDSGSYSGSDRD